MRSKKILAWFAAFQVLTFSSLPMANAEDFGTFRADVLDAITRLAAKYEARIAELEAENSKLKSELSALKSPTVSNSSTSVAPTATTPQPTTSNPSTIVSGSGSGNAKFDSLMASTNGAFKTIVKDYGLSEDSELGLFEFVNGADAFFVSIDDGKNPSGVSAFKTKILFSYDANLKTSVAGVFDLDYGIQKYRTVSGGNPYGTFARTRVKNPSYKGKLLDIVVAPPTGSSTAVPMTAVSTKPSAASPTTVQPAVSWDVTAKAVRAAYDKNKLKDAVALADAYLAKNPSDTDILTVRYRSLYILGRYAESLKDIQSIETLQGAKFDCTVAKDAAFIAKAAKNAELATKYASFCKKP